MLTEDELLKTNELCSKNSEFSLILNRWKEEHNLLLSSITHELRNPLTLIQSTLQLMEKRNPQLLNITYWEQISDDIKNLGTLLNDLSAYGHCEQLCLSETNLYDLISSLKQRFDAFSPEKDILITIDASSESKENISKYLCDNIKIREVFTNILKNAVEAIETQGKIKISINAEQSSLMKDKNGNPYLSIRFTNNGLPIPDTEIDSIFTPYITYKEGGTGMGLSICQKIINAHKGFLRVSSSKKETTFTVLLPFI